jgi:hypothetical protein
MPRDHLGQSVERLVSLGPFPAEKDATEAEVELRQALIQEVGAPISDLEATALLSLLGDDDFFGLAWSIVTIVESAPGWPFWEEILRLPPEWRRMLSDAATNAGFTPPSRCL